MIELRALTAEDWADWRALRLAALAEAPHAFGSVLADWQGSGDQEERWRARLRIAGSLNLIARVDGEPAGMASGVPAGEPGIVELISMWVRPAVRGHGVGVALIGEVARWAGHGGATTMRLSVVPGNAPARALYRRCGFADTGAPGDLLADGVTRELVMERPLPG